MFGENFLLTESEVNKLISCINYQLDSDESLSDDYANKLYYLRLFLERTKNRKFYGVE